MFFATIIYVIVAVLPYEFKELLCESPADDRNPEIHYILGKVYLFIKKDHKKAYYYFERAVKNGIEETPEVLKYMEQIRQKFNYNPPEEKSQ